MFDSYKKIFDKRGLAYHQAMIRYPSARAQEFRQILKFAEIEPRQTVVDIPSGGCYIRSFIDPSVHVVSIETSHQFVREVQSSKYDTLIVCDDISSTSLQNKSVDRVISLAGVHHIMDKLSFFQEAFRVLDVGGLFCIGDANVHSKVANFLDTFVDKNSSMGHRGCYLNSHTVQELMTAGFAIVQDLCSTYHWTFSSPQEMAEYCQLLFGIDCANEKEIIAGIDYFLGFTSDNEKCSMSWELRFIKCMRQTS